MSNSAEKLKPWEQQPGEPNGFFEQFATYLKMERVDRSIRATWAVLNPDKIADGRVAPGSFFDAPKAWQWEDRARAYDLEMDRKVLKRLENRRLKSLEETADLGEMLRKKAQNAARMLVGVEQRVGVDGAGREIVIVEVKLTPSDIARLASVGVELEQLALGNPTQRVSLGEDPNSPFMGPTVDSAKEEMLSRIAEMRKRREELSGGDDPTVRQAHVLPAEIPRDDDGEGRDWVPVKAGG